MHHPEGKLPMNMPKDPILLAMIPEGLDNELVQELLEDDDLNRLSRSIVILEARIAKMGVTLKDADVKPLTNLVEAIRKAIQTKFDIAVKRERLVPIDWVAQIADIYMSTFYEIEDDPHKRNEFLARARARVRSLKLGRIGRKGVSEIQLLESSEE